MKIALSAGHGPATAGKRSPDGMNEHDFTYPTTEYLGNFLREYQGVEILEVYSATEDVPLGTRTTRANNWGADLYVSVHGNAHGDGRSFTSANGIETLVYSNSTSESNGYNVGRKVQTKLIQATGLTNRGVKIRSDLWEMRSTNAPAILIEAGFFTNQRERQLMGTADFQRKVARAIADGIAEHYNLKKKANAPAAKPAPIPTAPTGSLKRVQIGAFSSKPNAERLEKEAESKGLDAFLHYEHGLYKVQIGAYSNYQNAKRQQDRARNLGFRNAFIN
jgi:N-acetylmuramoyl-L-alanine amidase